MRFATLYVIAAFSLSFQNVYASSACDDVVNGLRTEKLELDRLLSSQCSGNVSASCGQKFLAWKQSWKEVAVGIKEHQCGGQLYAGKLRREMNGVKEILASNSSYLKALDAQGYLSASNRSASDSSQIQSGAERGNRNSSNLTISSRTSPESPTTQPASARSRQKGFTCGVLSPTDPSAGVGPEYTVPPITRKGIGSPSDVGRAAKEYMLEKCDERFVVDNRGYLISNPKGVRYNNQNQVATLSGATFHCGCEHGNAYVKTGGSKSGASSAR